MYYRHTHGSEALRNAPALAPRRPIPGAHGRRRLDPGATGDWVARSRAFALFEPIRSAATFLRDSLERRGLAGGRDLRRLDLEGLLMEAIDRVVDGYGLGDATTVEEVVADLAPFVLQMDEAAGRAPDATFAARIARQALDILLNRHRRVEDTPGSREPRGARATSAPRPRWVTRSRRARPPRARPFGARRAARLTGALGRAGRPGWRSRAPRRCRGPSRRSTGRRDARPSAGPSPHRRVGAGGGTRRTGSS